MNTESIKQIRAQQVTRNMYATSYLLIVILVTFFAILISSCTSSRAVYERGSSWSPAEKNSNMTGWKYESK